MTRLDTLLQRRRIGDVSALAGLDGLWAQVLETMDEAILVAEAGAPGMPLVYVNRAFERITGYSAKEAVGRDCRFLQGADQQQPQVAQLHAALAAGEPVRVTLRNYRKGGALFVNDLSIVPLAGTDGCPSHFIGVMRDITERHELRSQLDRAYNLDRLTSVATRSFFFDQVTRLLETEPGVLLVNVDIADFHAINTSYGYDAGDALLAQVAERLTALSAGPVGRLGSDQFAFAISLERGLEPEAVLEDTQRGLEASFLVGDEALKVRFAIGYALANLGDDATALIRRAGVALRESRRSNLREPRSFDAWMDHRIQMGMRVTHDLQLALADSQFTLHLQPKVELATGALIGAEVLLRWLHPEFGPQSPATFIRMAEESGLIVDLGAWVIREAAALAARLAPVAGRALPVAVNVSQLQFTHRDLASLVEEAAREAAVDPSCLIVELTETTFAEDNPETREIFERLRVAGVGLSIDDFGRGCSSLAYFEQFPVTEIKIDKSFVRELHHSHVKQAIVQVVISLGAALGITVVAEGVETEAERDKLLEFGCAYGQGYLFGAPMPIDAFEKLVANQVA